jgi:pimeloyl-ACP methyl ester carboxylesterase
VTVIMVHGFPMTHHLWDPVVEALGDVGEDVIALDLPGFASPAPPGWPGTKEAYVEWLVGEVASIAQASGPVHLVGHDWGCLLSLRVAMLRPDLLRTIAAGNGPIDEHYPLHNNWREWAQPGVGERAINAITDDQIRERWVPALGLPADRIERLVSLFTPGNREIGLKLYRSAVNVGSEWAPDLPKIVAPSLILWGEQDMVVPVIFGRRMAARMGAEVVTLPGEHFWQFKCPELGATALRRHWEQFATYEPPESLKRTALPY